MFDYEAFRNSLPEVDIYADHRIWVSLDEGCNSNCHGAEWMRNAEAKYAKLGLSDLVELDKTKTNNSEELGISRYLQTANTAFLPACDC